MSGYSALTSSVPGKLEAFGLGWEQVRKINPKLIYCSVTGYGSTGPYASAPGYDVVIEAEAGYMHITGERDGPPVKVSNELEVDKVLTLARSASPSPTSSRATTPTRPCSLR